MTEGVTKPQRAFATHTPKWQRFQSNITLPSGKAACADQALSTAQKKLHPFQRQYSHVYHQRMAALKPRCLQAVNQSSSEGSEEATEVSRILELTEDVLSVVVGTVVKEPGDGPTIGEGSNCHEKDILVLEDESGRVTLRAPNNTMHQWCTGVVVAVRGTVLSSGGGVMQVDEFFAPAPVPHPLVAGNLQPSSGAAPTPPHVLFVSGLDCGSPNVSSLPRDMLLAYLEGNLDAAGAAKVCRVVVAGGGSSSKITDKSDPAFGIKELDGWIAQVCAAGIPVDLIPGQDDPTTANWPQRPLHSSLLKYSGTFMNNMLHRTPNPYACGLGDNFVLGSDGRNVTDLQTYLLDQQNEPASELEALKSTLRWGHMCPTGPDSVPTVPHAESDPMVMTETPHVYFAGNCKRFDTDLCCVQEGETTTKTRLVCVPRFADTNEAVLVNLETLDCELLRFDDQA